MIKTTYVSVTAPMDDLPNFPFFTSATGVAKRRVLDIDKSVKATLTILMVAIFAVGGFVIDRFTNDMPRSGLMLLLGLIVLTGMRFTWGCISQDLPKVEGHLEDEAVALRKINDKLASMKDMLPEGTGYLQRIDEFGRIAYTLMKECSRLPNMGARSKNFHQVQDEIRTKMLNLVESGNELADLIASRRAENTLESIRHLGIDEYVEHVSLETMAFRALTTGDDEPEPEPEPKKEEKVSWNPPNVGGKALSDRDALINQALYEAIKQQGATARRVARQPK